MPGSAEVVLRAIDALNARNLEAFIDVMDPEVRIEGLLSQVEGAHVGHDGARAWWDRLLETWPDWHTEVVEVEERGEGAVTQIRIRGHAAGSATPLEQSVWVAARIRDGRCVWWGVPGEKEEALRSVTGEGVADLTRRAHESFNAQDLEEFLALMAEDVEIQSRLARFEGEAYRGSDGARRWWSQLFEVFPDFTTEIAKIEEHGDGAVTMLHTRGRGASSATPLAETIWQGTQWRAGRCVWWGIYGGREEALAALQARQAES